MEQEFDLRTYLNILRRRYLYLVLPMLPIIAVACGLAFWIPPVYHASAKILVQSQQIPRDLARPTVTTDASRQIAVIRQRLMTRTNLLEIARKFNLFPRTQTGHSPSDTVDMMRDATRIEQIAVGNQQSSGQAIAFSVSFDYGDPNKASSVANEFVKLILEQNIKTRTNRAAETHRFFVQQVARLDKSMAAQEALIVEFKREHEATLPESLGYRRVLHTRLQTEMSEIDRELAVLATDKERLQQSADGVLTEEEANSTEAEITRVKLQLTQLRAVYSERHPSVRKAKSRLAALEKESIAEAKKAAKSKDAKQTAVTAKAKSRHTLQIATIDRKADELNRRRANVQKRIEDVEEAILRTPQVEVALRKLTRKYDLLQAQHRTAQAKVAEAATGELLEESRQAERFEVIERATTPSRPSKPNRPQVILAGFFLSIVAGVGMVLLVELLDGSIHGAMDLERRLQLRPLATIPLIVTSEEKRKKRRGRMMWLLFGVLLIISLLVAVHLLYEPLDLLGPRLLGRVGL